MNVEQFYKELDELLNRHNPDKMKEFLNHTLNQVKEEGDIISKLVVLVESYRFYKSASITKEATKLGNEILALYQEALPAYEEKLVQKENMLLGIYSTIAELLSIKEEFNQACEMIKKMIKVLALYEGTENEIAYSYTNLTVNYLRSNNIESAQEAIGHAISIYNEMKDEKPEGYGIALSGLAEVYYLKKEYINAIATYKGALDEIRKHYGESYIYANALENCAKVCYEAGYGEEAQSLLEHAEMIKKQA